MDMNVLRTYWLVFVVLIVGSLAAFGVFYTVYHVESQRIERDFISAAQDRVRAIQNTLHNHLNVLSNIRPFYVASKEVTKTEFSQFTQGFFAHYPGITRLMWIPHITSTQRTDFIETLKTNQALLHEYTDAGELIPTTARSTHYPVHFIVPFEAKLLGFDLSSDAIMLNRLALAEKQGDIIATSAYPLLADISTDLQAIIPVFDYQTHSSQSATNPSKQLSGFLLMNLTWHKIVGQALSAISPQPIQVHITNNNTEDLFIYSYPEYDYPNEANFFSRRLLAQKIDLGGSVWTLECKTNNSLMLADRTLWIWSLLWGGWAFTVLAAFYLLSAIRRTNALQKEIEQRQHISDALHAKDLAFRNFVNRAPAMLWMTDPKGRCLLVNQRWADFVANINPKGFTSRWLKSIHPDDLGHCQVQYNACFGSEIGQQHEDYHLLYRAMRKDGQYRWIAETSIARFGVNGEFEGYTGACIDTTEQHEMEEALRLREAEFRLFLNSAPVMLWMSSQGGKHVQLNDTMQAFVGQSPESNHARQVWLNAIHVEDAADYLSMAQRAVQDHKPYYVQYRAQRADGEYRWISETATPRTDVNGEFAGYTSACVDITDQRAAEKAMFESQRTLMTLMGNLPGMAYRCLNDMTWEMEFVSEGCYPLTGYHPQDFLHNRRITFASLIHVDDRDRVWDSVQNALVEQTNFQHHYRIRNADGTEKWVWGQGQGIFNEYGDLVAVEGFISDISEQKRAEEALNQARQMAEEANLAKSQFLANMSHELRTPLNAIMGYTEIIQEEAEDLGLEDFIPDLLKIKASGKHLLGLISDILDISKIEAGKMELFFEDLDLQEIVEQVVATMQPLLKEKNNTLTVERETAFCRMHSDATKIRQVLLNLLSNASKFSSDDNLILRISRQTDYKRDDIVLTVIDHGIGIAPEQQEKLFQIFMQADASSTRRYGGTGLGLAITYQFVQMLNGEIEVDSVYGEGSTFIVRIPVAVSINIDKESHKPLSVAHQANLAAEHIVVIDDDESVRATLQNYLSRFGYHVSVATNGADGVLLAKQVRPDVLIVDLTLPQHTTWHTLEKIKQTKELNDSMVMLMSFDDSRNVGYQLPANDYLFKPLNRTQLRDIVYHHTQTEAGASILVVSADMHSVESIYSTLSRYVLHNEESGQAGLAQLTEQVPKLILLDLLLPDMSALSFTNRLQAHSQWQGIPVIFLVGHYDNAQYTTLSDSVKHHLTNRNIPSDAILAHLRDTLNQINTRKQDVSV